MVAIQPIAYQEQIFLTFLFFYHHIRSKNAQQWIYKLPVVVKAKPRNWFFIQAVHGNNTNEIWSFFLNFWIQLYITNIILIFETTDVFFWNFFFQISIILNYLFYFFHLYHLLPGRFFSFLLLRTSVYSLLSALGLIRIYLH